MQLVACKLEIQPAIQCRKVVMDAKVKRDVSFALLAVACPLPGQPGPILLLALLLMLCWSAIGLGL